MYHGAGIADLSWDELIERGSHQVLRLWDAFINLALTTEKLEDDRCSREPTCPQHPNYRCTTALALYKTLRPLIDQIIETYSREELRTFAPHPEIIQILADFVQDLDAFISSLPCKRT